MREVFQKARQAAPCIVFCDEIDALVPVRSSMASDAHVSERVLSQFLAEFDGIDELKGVLILGATNRLDILDPAVIRPGRFDEIVEIPIPGKADREAILSMHLRNKPVAKGISAAQLATRNEGFSGAELASVCNIAALNAVRRAIEEGRIAPNSPAKVLITDVDLDAALKEVHKA